MHASMYKLEEVNIFLICNLYYDGKKYLDLFKALITVGLLFTWILQSRLSIPEKWKAKQL